MATKATRRRAVVVEEVDGSDYLLQDILELPEPERTHVLNEWVEAAAYDVEHGGTVLIGTPNKKPMQFRYQGEMFNVPPAGRRVTREVAIRLLTLYGEHGRYYGRDQATGVMLGQEEMFTEEEQKWASRRKFNYITNFLVQRPEKQTSENERSAFDRALAAAIADEEAQEDTDNGENE